MLHNPCVVPVVFHERCPELLNLETLLLSFLLTYLLTYFSANIPPFYSVMHKAHVHGGDWCTTHPKHMTGQSLFYIQLTLYSGRSSAATM